jgi:DNA-binding transcriptional ArsR family regulator
MRASKRGQILELLSFHREGLTWREIVGKHRWSSTSIGIPDLYWKKGGQTLEHEQLTIPTREVIYGEWYFPRQTLDRHLKALVAEGIVEKVQEPRKQGERGRPTRRYRIKHWYEWGCMYARYPAKRVGHRWFLGTRIERLGKKHVRLYPREKEEFDKLRMEDKSFAATVRLAQQKRRKMLRKGEPDLGFSGTES